MIRWASSADSMPRKAARWVAAIMPHAHRFTMQKAHVSCFRFDRMADGVAEIENAAKIAFAFVRGHHSPPSRELRRQSTSSTIPASILAEHRQTARPMFQTCSVTDDAAFHHLK